MFEEFTDNSADEDVSASSDAPESVSREPLHQDSDTSGIGQARNFFAHFQTEIVKSASGPTFQGSLAENAPAIKYFEEKKLVT